MISFSKIKPTWNKRIFCLLFHQKIFLYQLYEPISKMYSLSITTLKHLEYSSLKYANWNNKIKLNKYLANIFFY